MQVAGHLTWWRFPFNYVHVECLPQSRYSGLISFCHYKWVFMLTFFSFFWRLFIRKTVMIFKAPIHLILMYFLSPQSRDISKMFYFNGFLSRLIPYKSAKCLHAKTNVHLNTQLINQFSNKLFRFCMCICCSLDHIIIN